VSPVKYELSFYIPEDNILHSDRRENLKSYMNSHYFTSFTSPVHYFVTRPKVGVSIADKADGFFN
jgi:hypothetical protein